MIAKLGRDLGRLIRMWWRGDRIRISPREGLLLRTEPGDLILIGETQAEVVSRSIIAKSTGPILCLNCHTQTGSAELQVSITIDGKPSAIHWKEADDYRLLTSEEFEVWPRRRMVCSARETVR